MKYKYLLLIILIIFTTSCKKYLDAKPDKSLVVPQTVSDLQAMLDNDNLLNATDPQIGEVASDNYYITEDFYQYVPTLLQDCYVWQSQVRFDQDWELAYGKIYTADLVLDYINKVNKGSDINSYNKVIGSAYFFRGYSLFLATQIYTLPYAPGKNDGSLGMPLKETTDITDPTSRATLKETYEHIINDLKFACAYLPKINTPISRPGKAVAFGVLANVYLQIQDYKSANLYADSSLQISNGLIDFNSLDSNSTNPISRGNSEVLFQSRISGVLPLDNVVYRIDSLLYNSYLNNDLRKVIFFAEDFDGTATFKGGYDANSGGEGLFSGFAVDELYLIKAECLARLGDLEDAGKNLDLLLKNRYRTGQNDVHSFTDQDQALDIILSERRKELVFRAGRRWCDLRRLNLETKYAKTLKRYVAGTSYVLQPNDLRYAFLIPESAITIGKIEQNAR